MSLQGLIFPFSELILECELFKAYASNFLDKTTFGCLDEAKGTLQSIQKQGSPTRTTAWQIPLARPLTTLWSQGESQRDGKSRHIVRAQFSFVWDIRPLDEKEWRGRKYCLLDGRASTLVRLIDNAGACLAQWTADVGDQQSPGAHFHHQMNGFDAAPFPKSFDIPRLPGMAMSPFLAMELAIGELFQDRWRSHALADSRVARSWRNIHGPRLRRFFKWQIGRLPDQLAGSPWIALKVAKPQPNMLIVDL